MNIEQIDAFCDLFEKRLKGGAKVSVEQFLAEQQLPVQELLLAELRKLKADYDQHDPGPRVVEKQPDADDVNDPTMPFQPDTDKVKVGNYKLLQKIGEGGMGVVYMAEQTHPVTRRVALKIVKPGMDSKEVLARFEAERQALSLMEHPNIAHVLDAGTTDNGLPYFVMELVKGVPITAYCDNKHLSPKERLELFIPICQAVQHAHQKGVIHRDLKPSNVLIAQYDNRPVPKIIDFGLAKAIGQRLTERTMFTQFGQIVGTIDYMSPEQASFNQLDVDTRSDVYSLGVLLYELLTGETPFDKKRLHSAAIEEMLRIIRQEEPPRPSARLSSHASLPCTEAKQRTEIKKLSVMIRGELDWIVMKAIDKERERRYQSPSGFADDIQRYLQQDSVQACPPSVSYRLRKFVRRNKVAVAIGVILVLAMMSLAAAGVQAVNRRALIVAKDREEAQRQRAEQARDVAERQKKRANRYMYRFGILQAERYWSEGNRVAAIQVLTDLPGDHRDWEWYFLHRRYFESRDGVPAMQTVAAQKTSIAVAGFVGTSSKTIVSLAVDGTARVDDADFPDRSHVFAHFPQPVLCAAIDRQGTLIAAVSGPESASDQHSQSTVTVQNIATGAILMTASAKGIARSVALSSDCRRLAVALDGHTVLLWSLLNVRQEPLKYQQPSSISEIAFTNDGTQLAGLLESDENSPLRIIYWNLHHTGEVIELGQDSEGFALAFSPEGRLVIGNESLITVWNSGAYHVPSYLHGHRGPVRYLRFSSGGARLFSAANDGTVKLWEWGGLAKIDTEHQPVNFEAHIKKWGGILNEAILTLDAGVLSSEVQVTSLNLDASGHHLVVATSDGKLRVWDGTPQYQISNRNANQPALSSR